MEKILLFDTAEGSDNIGDQIIMDFCEKQLELIFLEPNFFVKSPTHLEIGKTTYRYNKEAHYSLVCGTNILKTSILFHKLWKISLCDILKLHNICLMGCGWGNYTSFNTDLYTQWAYHKILSKKMLHSVRDRYTLSKLHSIGIENVIFTACPTMWNLTPEFCNQIPIMKSKDVVTTLTYYKKDIYKDRLMLDLLNSHYETIYFWPQQADDLDYLYSLNCDYNIIILRPTLYDYDNLLRNKDVDFIGTRLHGGIRALNFKKRALIIGVDNRAIEINRDTNLPVLNREDITQIENWIYGQKKLDINLPVENINIWKSQFIK